MNASIPISPAATSTLLRQLRAATSLEEACHYRNLLVENHLSLVQGVVRTATWGRPWLPQDDAYQEACCALIQAAVSASPERAAEFPAYARTAMLHRVGGLFAAQDSPTTNGRTPRRLVLIRSFLAAQGVLPDECPDAKIAAGTALFVGTVARLRPWITKCPLAAAADESSRDGGAAVEAAERVDDIRQLRVRVAALPERERWILTLAFGLDEREPQSVPKIAAAMGASRQYALRCYQRALRRLRTHWRE